MCGCRWFDGAVCVVAEPSEKLLSQLCHAASVLSRSFQVARQYDDSTGQGAALACVACKMCVQGG